MKELNIYETNAALGYNELAYLIRLDTSENGFNYLCIGTDERDKFFGQSYTEGKRVLDYSDSEVVLSTKKISDFEFCKGFLFEHFLGTYNFMEKECEHPYAFIYSKCGYEKCNKCGKVLCEG